MQSLVEDYAVAERFDLVLCEGTIPFQLDPPAFLRQVAEFAAPGGVVVTTCVDGVSMLAETLRRLVAAMLVDPGLSTAEKLERLLPVFSPHLATLKGMSRPHEDWILDQLVQPLVGRLLSIEDAIDALNDGFDVHGSSPHFITDWRWYKDIHGSQRAYNEVARGAYLRNLHNLLDYRFVGEPRRAEQNHDLLAHCDAVFYLVQEFSRTGNRDLLGAVVEKVAAVAKLCRTIAPGTAEGLGDFLRVFEAWRSTGQLGPFDAFAACFGRGQQYLSFIRRG